MCSGNTFLRILCPFWQKGVANIASFSMYISILVAKPRLAFRVCAVKFTVLDQLVEYMVHTGLREILRSWVFQADFLGLPYSSKGNSHFIFPKEKTKPKPTKNLCLSRTVLLGTSLFLWAVLIPRHVLEIRHFVSGATRLQHLCLQRTPISDLLLRLWVTRITLGNTFWSLQAKDIKI